MIYIIDANNLAGRMGLLEEDDFNKLLEDIVSDYFSQDKNEVFLVFDGSDPMGDKRTKGKLQVVMSPKDKTGEGSADEKILEIVDKKIYSKPLKEEISVVTDDSGLKERIAELAEEGECVDKIIFIPCSDFSEKINKAAEGVNDDFFEPADISDEEQGAINEELKQIWN